jgi:hypothetical protein
MPLRAVSAPAISGSFRSEFWQLLVIASCLLPAACCLL